MGWANGSLLADYQQAILAADEESLEDNTLAVGLQTLIREKGTWEGRVTELLGLLNDKVSSAERGPDWPRTAPALGSQIHRIAPILKRCWKIEVSRTRVAERRTIKLEQLSD